MRTTSGRGIVFGVAGLLAASVLLPACGGDDSPAQDVGSEDTYVPCTEEMCTSGNRVCCPPAGPPGTWDPMRTGCVCPGADADADADADVVADADADEDVAPDVDEDVASDVDEDVPTDADEDGAAEIDEEVADAGDDDAAGEA